MSGLVAGDILQGDGRSIPKVDEGTWSSKLISFVWITALSRPVRCSEGISWLPRVLSRIDYAVCPAQMQIARLLYRL